MSETIYDVVVFGAGPDGSTLATLLADKHGLKVALIERETSPGQRSHESSADTFEGISVAKLERWEGASLVHLVDGRKLLAKFVVNIAGRSNRAATRDEIAFASAFESVTTSGCGDIESDLPAE